MRYYLILLFLVSTRSFGQNQTNYKLAIGDSMYQVYYSKSYQSFDPVFKVFRKDQQEEIWLRATQRCDTVPIGSHDPTIANPFRIDCQNFIGVTDTLRQRTIQDVEKLVSNGIFTFMDTLKIIPDTVWFQIIDENYNRILLNNKNFDIDKIKNFSENKITNIYVIITKVELTIFQNSIVIYPDIGCRLQ